LSRCEVGSVTRHGMSSRVGGKVDTAEFVGSVDGGGGVEQPGNSPGEAGQGARLPLLAHGIRHPLRVRARVTAEATRRPSQPA